MHLVWAKPLPLRISAENYVYELDVASVPTAPGIYCFYRQHGDTQSVLYVGKAENLRARIKQQLNAVKLMLATKNSSAGSRYLVFGEFAGKPGQQYRKCLPVIARGLIRHFLSKGHDLLNKQGTRIAQHTVVSKRNHLKNLIPRA
ncbi:MAG: hypothetical protein ACRD7E_25050, partial [Bryobacteraceae bacterium]